MGEGIVPEQICLNETMAEGPVCSQLVSASNSLYQGKIQGKSQGRSVHSLVCCVTRPIQSGFSRIQWSVHLPKNRELTGNWCPTPSPL